MSRSGLVGAARRYLRDTLIGVSLLCVAAQVARGQGYPLWTFTGSTPGGQLGRSVAEAGDVDGDGLPDVIVGAPYAGTGGLVAAGQAKVLSGATGAVLFTFGGSAPGEGLGWSVSGAGDVNGDGFSDFVVGARDADPGGTQDAGQAKIFSGATGALLLTCTGSASFDWLGYSVAGAGDPNSDGFGDILIGAPLADPGGIRDAGEVKVFSGATGAVLFTFAGSSIEDWLGWSVAGAGDVDGDGFDDILSGAPRADSGLLANSGQARVFSGANGALLLVFNGSAAFDNLGWSVAGAGDVNGDGLDDLIVGAPFATLFGLGQARVFSGATGSVLLTLNALAGDSWLGYSVAGAGDLNGDGVDDLVVGAPASITPSTGFLGRARVFSGSNGSPLFTFSGSVAGGGLGSSVAGPGDVNGDGVPDLFVGSPGSYPGGPAQAGEAKFFSVVGIPPGSTLSGAGCPGSSGVDPAIHTAGGNPTPGNASFAIVLSKARGGATALLLAGVSTLTANLSGFGIPACTLLVLPDFAFPAATTADGLAFLPVPIPPIPSLAGSVVPFQWYVVDPGPAPLPGAMTSRLEVAVQ